MNLTARLLDDVEQFALNVAVSGHLLHYCLVCHLNGVDHSGNDILHTIKPAVLDSPTLPEATNLTFDPFNWVAAR